MIRLKGGGKADSWIQITGFVKTEETANKFMQEDQIHRVTYLKSVYLIIDMPTKTISVLEEVYKELLKHKKSRESFSDELLRLVHGRGKISECAGLWSWMEASEITSIEKSIDKRRKLSKLAKREKSRLIK